MTIINLIRPTILAVIMKSFGSFEILKRSYLWIILIFFLFGFGLNLIVIVKNSFFINDPPIGKFAFSLLGIFAYYSSLEAVLVYASYNIEWFDSIFKIERKTLREVNLIDEKKFVKQHFFDTKRARLIYWLTSGVVIIISALGIIMPNYYLKQGQNVYINWSTGLLIGINNNPEYGEHGDILWFLHPFNFLNLPFQIFAIILVLKVSYNAIQLVKQDQVRIETINQLEKYGFLCLYFNVAYIVGSQLTIPLMVITNFYILSGYTYLLSLPGLLIIMESRIIKHYSK